jgi:hypothetical protein
MCHARDFRAFDFRREKKPEEARPAQDKRAEAIDALLADANEHAERERRERAPAKEAAPAK